MLSAKENNCSQRYLSFLSLSWVVLKEKIERFYSNVIFFWEENAHTCLGNWLKNKWDLWRVGGRNFDRCSPVGSDALPWWDILSHDALSLWFSPMMMLTHDDTLPWWCSLTHDDALPRWGSLMMLFSHADILSHDANLPCWCSPTMLISHDDALPGWTSSVEYLHTFISTIKCYWGYSNVECLLINTLPQIWMRQLMNGKFHDCVFASCTVVYFRWRKVYVCVCVCKNEMVVWVWSGRWVSSVCCQFWW